MQEYEEVCSIRVGKTVYEKPTNCKRKCQNAGGISGAGEYTRKLGDAIYDFVDFNMKMFFSFLACVVYLEFLNTNI